MIIADGYDRICPVYSLDEGALIALQKFSLLPRSAAAPAARPQAKE
jgi:hypothetical protein